VISEYRRSALDDLLRGHVQLDRQLFGGRLAAQVLQHLALHPGQLVDDLDQRPLTITNADLCFRRRASLSSSHFL
jgi:hypothetical protein